MDVKDLNENVNEIESDTEDVLEGNHKSDAEDESNQIKVRSTNIL